MMDLDDEEKKSVKLLDLFLLFSLAAKTLANNQNPESLERNEMKHWKLEFRIRKGIASTCLIFLFRYHNYN